MARFHASFRALPAIPQGGAVFDIRTSSTDYALLLSLELTTIGASGSAISLGIGTPASIGVAKPSGIVLLAEDASTPPNVSVGIDWTTPPTVPAKFLRRVSVLGSTSGSIRYVFPEGLKIAPSSSLVLWVITEAAAAAVQFLANVEIDG